MLAAGCSAVLLAPATTEAAAEIPSVFASEVARFTRLAGSASDDLRIEAAQGFGWLKHPSGETPLLPLAKAESPVVRLTATKALGVCGGRRTVPVLIERLGDSEWEIRRAAHDALRRMTGQTLPADARDAWGKWLEGSDWQAKEGKLLGQLKKGDRAARLRALRALRFVGSSRAEVAVLAVLAKPGDLGGDGVKAAIQALERIGTAKALPLLAPHAVRWPGTAWTLGQVGGPKAEEILLKAFRKFGTRTLDVMVNLDRVESTRCAEFLPTLLRAFGLVIYRSRPDELHRPPDAVQRTAANLILRTGQAPRLVDLVLAEVEGKRKNADTPPPLRKLLAGMRHELKRGFVRSDGMTVAQPLAALPHIATDKRFVPRLVALLDHRAYLVRIYVAMTLAALKAESAVPKILKVVREPYPFVDAATQASGKHFGRSQTVRWRGYLCIALGRLGGEPARAALEALAGDPTSFRDIRYGSVVGLKFLGSPKSVAVLERVAEQDIIWAIQREAEEAVAEIRLGEGNAQLADDNP